MTFKVIHLLQGFSNANSQTFVHQFARFHLAHVLCSFSAIAELLVFLYFMIRNLFTSCYICLFTVHQYSIILTNNNLNKLSILASLKSVIFVLSIVGFASNLRLPWYCACYKLDYYYYCLLDVSFSSLMLMVGRQEEHLTRKKLEQWGDGAVICLE